MKIKEKIMCAIGMHGSAINIGAGSGGVLVQGRHLMTECRIWKCERCGKEWAKVTCPQCPGITDIPVTPEFVRRTLDYTEFQPEEQDGAVHDGEHF